MPEVRIIKEPRNGQWMKFHIADKALADSMRKAGCFETPDHFFLSIWRAAGRDPRNDEAYPGKLMCVDNKGDNVMVFVKAENQLYNISYNLDDAVVADLQAMTKKEHFPPNYVGLTDRDPLP